jgi:hypothetical protein
MCNLCESPEQSMRHYGSRTSVLVGLWKGSRLDEGPMDLATAQLAAALEITGQENTDEHHALLVKAHGLFDRALVQVMQTHPQETCTEEELNLVELSRQLDRFIEDEVLETASTSALMVAETENINLQ